MNIVLLGQRRQRQLVAPRADLTGPVLRVAVLGAAVGDAVALLLENPQPGSPRDFRSPHAQGIRSWAPQGFPNYLIFYKVSGDDIEVIRFLHGARDLPHHFEQDP